jgi:hypothetical protein
MNDHMGFAKLCLMKKKYQKALLHIEKYQAKITSQMGNHAEVLMMKCYTIKIQCYIGLENKRMSKKALKFLKKF